MCVVVSLTAALFVFLGHPDASSISPSSAASLELQALPAAFLLIPGIHPHLRFPVTVDPAHCFV